MVRTSPLSEVLIVGAGPAGLALAAELGRRSIAVTVVERHLGRGWDRSYGAWAAALPAADFDPAIVARFERPQVTFTNGDTLALEHAYVRFDTARLQALLEQRALAAGARLVPGDVASLQAEPTAHVVALRDPGGRVQPMRARLVVNCGGRALDDRTQPPAYQTAFGAWFEVASTPLASSAMSLMDLRRASACKDGLASDSFLYALPERPGVLFAQETVLASRRAASLSVLEARLLSRLRALGVVVRRQIQSERCLIPLGSALPAAGTPVLAFGAAAGLIQPSSGYSLARSLRLAPRLAEALATSLEARALPTQRIVDQAWATVWPVEARAAWHLHRYGLEALLRWHGGEIDAFWRAFFALPGDLVPRFLDGSLPAPDVARAMWRVFSRLPQRLRLHLLRSGARFLVQPSHHPGVS